MFVFRAGNISEFERGVAMVCGANWTLAGWVARCVFLCLMHLVVTVMGV